VIENAADYQAFAVDPPALREPADLAAVPRPRIGYTGALNRKVDFPLLVSIASRHPLWQIVLVGALGNLDAETTAAVSTLRQLSNVHFLGFKDHRELPQYVGHMDVNLLAYRLAPHLWTQGIYPLKLHEYLAAGRPVVSADLPSVRPFAEVVHVVRESGGWETAIAAALDGHGTGSVESRRAVARNNGWDARALALERWLGTCTPSPPSTA
jgi:glycosyltransferase involved in cell wall biosynthesis